MFSPREIDRKSLALHQLVVEKIERDPRLFELVQITLDGWRSRPDWSRRPYLAKWQNLVDQGMDVALKVAVEESDRGQVLRQASPFAGILTESERQAFLHTWSHQHEPA